MAKPKVSVSQTLNLGQSLAVQRTRTYYKSLVSYVTVGQCNPCTVELPTEPQELAPGLTRVRVPNGWIYFTVIKVDGHLVTGSCFVPLATV